MSMIAIIFAYSIGCVLSFLLGAILVYVSMEDTPNANKPPEPDMPRRPLTQEQLDECLKAKEDLCPRCGCSGDSEIAEETAGSMCEDGTYLRELSCNECNEKWNIYYTATKVVSSGDEA